MIKPYLLSLLVKALEGSPYGTVPLSLEIPKQESHGEFAITIAFRLAGSLKLPPKTIAESIAGYINSHSDLQPCLSAEALNGFVNLHLKTPFIWDYFLKMLDKAVTYPSPSEKMLFEYVSANPTGPLHIGHGRWAVIGSAIATLLKETGHHLTTEFYINDAGSQVKKFYDSVNAVKKGLPVPEDGYHGAYIRDLAALDADPLQTNIVDQKMIMDRLGVHFDSWFSEKSLHESGAVKKAMVFLKNQDLSYESEGALWFKAQQFGDEKDRVLIKADGAYTYFAVDVAYHFNKIDRGYTRLVNMFGADHHGYVPRIRAAVKAMMGSTFNDRSFEIVIGQLVSLLRGGEPVRMSKRTGDMISLEEVVDEIGVDATRFFLVQKSPDSHIEFDLEVAKARSSDNPVFYLHYAHARMSTLLSKAETPLIDQVTITTLHQAEREIIVKCLTLHDVIWESASKLAPHVLAQYAYDLAKTFHVFYEACPILKAEPALINQRLMIVHRVRFVLAKCLTLLGLSAPDSM